MKKKIVATLLTGVLSLGLASTSFAEAYKQGATLYEKETEEISKTPEGKRLIEKAKIKIKENQFDKNGKHKFVGEVSIQSQVKIQETFTDPNVSEYYGTTYAQMHPYKMWNQGFTGKGVKVAVLDSGIDKEHPDLVIKGGVSFVPGVTSYDDDQGHGTHVAGIIGAKKNGFGVVGIAPDADLYAVKVMASNGSGEIAWIIKGIDWAIANDMDIINMSLGATSSMLTAQEKTDWAAAVNRAYSAGIIITGASGNDGTGTISYPARWNSILAIGATEDDKSFAWYSNYGPEQDLVAPGGLISTYPTDQPDDGDYPNYTYMWGTSMSAPVVAGMAANYKQQFPLHTPSQAYSNITGNSKWRYDLGPVGFDEKYGNGLSSNKYMP